MSLESFAKVDPRIRDTGDPLNDVVGVAALDACQDMVLQLRHQRNRLSV